MTKAGPKLQSVRSQQRQDRCEESLEVRFTTNWHAASLAKELQVISYEGKEGETNKSPRLRIRRG